MRPIVLLPDIPFFSAYHAVNMRSIHRTVKGRVVEVDEVDRNGRLLLFSRVVVAAKRLSRLVSMRKIPY